MRWLSPLMLAGVLLASPAAAEVPGSAGYEDAPLPREARGLEVRPPASDDWRAAARWLLNPPRWALQVLAFVPRRTVRAYHRYRLKARYLEIFFNDDETLGVYPTLFVETGFGLNAGARLVHRRLFGDQGKLRLRAGYGGTSQIVAAGAVESDWIAGNRLNLELAALFRIGPRERFFGYGNADEGEQPSTLADPLAGDTAISTRFRQRGFKLEIAEDVRLARGLTLRASQSYDRRDFESFAGSSTSVEQVFDTSLLPGYQGTSNLYGQLELELDTRRTTAHHLWKPAHSTGWRLAAFAGYQYGFEDDPSNHMRWGGLAERLFDLYGGDRVLVVRIANENIAGRLTEVPFVSLPSLGGPQRLRGYVRGRFRDRHSVLGTVEYRYPILRMVSGFIFVDSGQVFRDWSDFDIRNRRTGYGFGLQAHTRSNFLGRAMVSSSLDGGLFLNLVFNPDTRVDSRGFRQL